VIRRRSLLAAPALLGAGCARVTMPPPIPSAAPGPGLHQRAAAKGIAFGAAVNTRQVAEPDTAAAIRAECGLLVAEYEMKWDRVEPQRGDRRFLLPDRLVEFARDNRMGLRGHTLVWHESEPPWLARLEARGLAGAMQAHIEATAGRWRGRIVTWDVVNEAVRPEDGRADWLRRTRMLEALGPDYIPPRSWPTTISAASTRPWPRGASAWACWRCCAG
jgi:endo-1,4-beta-xylanase